ncbi:MAG: DnaJ domain-containing protein [bacterium]
MSSTDFYGVLGVPRNATTEQIKERFLQLTREKHPDRFVGAEKQKAELDFQSITQAFNVLSNADRRRLHDLELARPTAQRPEPAELARVFMQRGVKAYKAKNYVEAAESFDRATEADPSNALAWHHLARTCLQQDRWLSRAAAAITRACELEPMKVEYHKLAGQILMKSGDRGKAASHFKQAIRWGGEDPEVSAALDEIEGKDAKRKSLLGGLFGRVE